MNIAVNTRLLPGEVSGGIEWFTYEIFSRLSKWHPEHKFYFVSDNTPDTDFVSGSNIESVVLKPVARHPILWYWWSQVTLPRFLKKGSFDLFVSPDGMIPLKTNIPCLSVIHDISFVHRKNDLPRMKSLFYNYYYPRFADRAGRIVTVSDYSKNDIVNRWNIDPGKVDIIYNGVSQKFFPENGDVPADTRRRYTNNNHYFLFVGNLSPRKNVVNLVKAYNHFRSESVNSHHLVIAGGRFFRNSELDREIRNSPFRDDIVFTGTKEQDELRRLYCAADSLLFTPWFEGFGIPVIEAMKCGTPVIASNNTALPEVCGDAALFVDPSDPGEISNGMTLITQENGPGNALRDKGLKRSAMFSWDTTAEKFWLSIQKTLKT